MILTPGALAGSAIFSLSLGLSGTATEDAVSRGIGPEPTPAVMADDPFAGLDPLGEDALAEARGGFVVGGYEVDVGLLVDTQGMLAGAFVTDLERINAALARSGVDPLVYDTVLGADSAMTTIVIENAMDDTVITQAARLDIVLTDTAGGIALRDGVAVTNFVPAPVLPGTF